MKKSALLAVALTLACSAWAQVPQHIDINGINGGKKGAEVIEDVVVPVPSEIFSVLDKQGHVAWVQVLKKTKDPIQPRGSQEQISLLLGTVIAEGFVAVEAQDPDEVKNIGKSVLELSKAIGVKKTVVTRSNAIISDADKKDWQNVRVELDKALQDVKSAMAELRSQNLAQLVSLGGWLRGTEALTQVVLMNYTAEGAELLHQPVLIKNFKRRVEALKKKDPLVQKIRQGLDQIEPLMGNGEGEISEKNVKDIQQICSDLLKAINQKPNQ